MLSIVLTALTKGIIELIKYSFSAPILTLKRKTVVKILGSIFKLLTIVKILGSIFKQKFQKSAIIKI